MVRLDSHQHFWRYNPVKYSWIDDNMSVLKRDYLPAELGKLLQEHQVNGSIAVQADQSEDETLFLLNLSNKFDFIKGVVGWIDLQSPALEERLDYFSTYSKLKGFRHIVQSEPDDSFLLRDTFMKGISQLEKLGYTYDILIYPRQLQSTLLFVKQFPNQKFVVDHIAKPDIKGGRFEQWAESITELSSYPNVFCKVSGMVTEADWKNWTYEDLVPYLKHIFDSFGPERIMFGSDWPVCLLAASYHQVKEIFDTVVSDLPLEQQKLVWGGNAIRFYNLQDHQ